MALIRSLVWERPYAVSAVERKRERKKERKRKEGRKKMTIKQLLKAYKQRLNS